MDRQTKEIVDEALAGVAAYAADGDASHNESVLAAEVIALRAELVETRREWAQHRCVLTSSPYATEAVDELLRQRFHEPGESLSKLAQAFDAARLSREPPL